ncbi:MAG: nuclear transport factor 2 family protein [Pseudomonadota bacterium]
MLSLQNLSDRIEIQDLLTRYCHAIDQRNWDALDDIFTPDAHIDYTATGGIAGQLTEIKPFLESAIPLFKSIQHFVTNPLLEIDGDRATARSLLLNPCTMARENGDHTLFIGAWYVDELMRQPDGWRISSRRQEKSFFHNQ